MAIKVVTDGKTDETEKNDQKECCTQQENMGWDMCFVCHLLLY